MTILHAHSDPQFTEHLRSVLAEANGQPHSVDIAVGSSTSLVSPRWQTSGNAARDGCAFYWRRTLHRATRRRPTPP